MLDRWLDPRCCCAAPGHPLPVARGSGGKFANDAGYEEINLGEAHLHGPGLRCTADINRARQRLGVRDSPPASGRGREVPTYAAAEVQELRGEPLFSGKILQLTLGEAIHEMLLAIHANGFSLVPCPSQGSGSPQPISRPWSPFSLVEKCQVKTMQNSAFWAVFKLSVHRKDGPDHCYYFATTGNNSYNERDRWVSEMVKAIKNVTMSLFPHRSITVLPLPDMPATSTRIMAGYLLQPAEHDNVALFFCELHAYSHGTARLAIYQDEWCETEVCSLPVVDNSSVSTRKGLYCAVFGIDGRRFCARTKEEKDLWVRAVSNIKVKLMFDAPEPSHEDLQIFRSAISERLCELNDGTEPASKFPLLARVARTPPQSPRGDFWEPTPIEESSVDEEEEIAAPTGVVDVSTPCSAVAQYSSRKAGVIDFGGDVCAAPLPEALVDPFPIEQAVAAEISSVTPRLVRDRERERAQARASRAAKRMPNMMSPLGEPGAKELCVAGCLRGEAPPGEPIPMASVHSTPALGKPAIMLL